MKRITIGNIIIIVIIIIVIVAGGLAYSRSQPESEAASPTLEASTVEVGNIVITPPDSLEQVAGEIVNDYPNWPKCSTTRS